MVRRFALAMATLVGGCGVVEGPVLTTRGTPTSPRALLVAWGAPAPRNAADLDAIAAGLGAGPRFDGIVIEVPVDKPWSATALDVSPATALAGRLTAPPFDALKANFLATRIAPGDAADEDDAAFAQVAANFGALARAARTVGARGIMLDTQTYERQVFSFPDIGRGRALADVQRSLRRRGGEVMRAMLAEAPDLTVVVTMGYADVWRAVCADGVPLESDRYGLLPAFLDGMRDALGAGRARQLVDGFLPAYATRTAEAFSFLRAAIAFDEAKLRAADARGAVSYRYPRLGAPAQFPWTVPAPLRCSPEVRAQLERVMPVGFGVMIDFASEPFDRTAPWAGNFHSPQGFGAVLRAALSHADELVWLYSAQIDWWARPGRTPLPPEYRVALDGAR